jgi:hypothetical protein
LISSADHPDGWSAFGFGQGAGIFLVHSAGWDVRESDAKKKLGLYF